VNVMLLLSAVYLSFVAVTVAILGCTSPFPEIYYSAADKRICPDEKNPEKKHSISPMARDNTSQLIARLSYFQLQ